MKNLLKCDIMELTKNTKNHTAKEVFTMVNYSTLNHNVKRGILNFSEKISQNLFRPKSKFISQMIYGILCAQSCHISKIARSLDEKISLKKTIDRLLRNLHELYEWDKISENYIRKIKLYVSDKTILIFDGSDIVKPSSPKMECISTVRDGSTGKYGEGYHTLGVAALTPERKMPISVYTRVYSASEPDFVSEDDEVLKALRIMSTHFKKSNIRAFDRGYDANVYFKYLLGNNELFVIRATKNRNVIYGDKTVNILALAKRFKGKYLLKFRKKSGIKADCKISITPIKLPCMSNEMLNLVVCNGFGKDPMMLITNMQSSDKRLGVVITKVYLLRWRIEEFYGFKKQQFGFEDFRVRSLRSIRNLDLLLTIAIGYIGMMSEKIDERQTVMELIHVSKRIRGTPRFVFYAIADGLFKVLARCKQGISDMLQRRKRSVQLDFWWNVGMEV